MDARREIRQEGSEEKGEVSKGGEKGSERREELGVAYEKRKGMRAREERGLKGRGKEKEAKGTEAKRGKREERRGERRRGAEDGGGGAESTEGGAL